MQSSLTVCRAVYYGTIVACVAILLYALVPDSSARYRDAIEELIALSSVPFDSAAADLQRTWRPRFPPVQTDAVTKLPEGPPYYAIMIGAVVADTARRWYLPELGHEYTLAELVEYTTTAKLFHVQPDSQPPPSFDTFEGDGFKCEDGMARDTSGRPTIQVRYCFADSLIVEHESDRYLTWVRPPSGDGMRRRVLMNSLPERRIPLDSATVWSWVISSPRTRNITAVHNGRHVFLPKLGVVWPEVRDLSPRQAEAEMQRRLTETKQRGTFLFGLAVDEGVVGMAAPIGLILLYLYFNAHLNHARSLLTRNSEPELKSFPWVMLFNNLSGTVARLITCILLPLVAIAALQVRLDLSNDGRFSVFDALVLLLIGAVGLVCYRSIAQLRRGFRIRQAQPAFRSPRGRLDR